MKVWCQVGVQVIDTLLGIGPMRDMTCGEAMSSAAAEWGQDSRRGPPQLVACSGQGKQGALSILRRNLVPELILEVPLPGEALIACPCLLPSRQGMRCLLLLCVDVCRVRLVCV